MSGHGNKKLYEIKWVGCRKTTKIRRSDFCDKALPDEYEKHLANKRLHTGQQRVYAYCRTSRRNSDREVSLEDQKEYCLKYAERNNLSVIGVYCDNGVSASKITNQFGLNFILNEIGPGEGIVFYDISRFSRDMMGAMKVLEELKGNGVIVHAIHDNVSWNGIATNRHNFRQLLSASQLHSDITSEKVKRSIEFRRRRGDHIGGTSYGYTTDLVNGVRKLVKDPEESQVVTSMFDEMGNIVAGNLGNLGLKKKRKKKLSKMQKRRKLNNMGDYDYVKIANRINNAGATNRQGKPFRWQHVKKIMKCWK